MSQTVCPACGQGAFEPREFIDVAEQHKLYAPDNKETQQELTAAASETASSYQMLSCRHCGLEFSIPMHAPSAAWYHLAYRALQPYPDAPWKPPHRWEFDEVLRHIPQGDHVFEFGCGFGPFLERCRENGVTASGIDFSQDAVAECLANGLDAREFDLNEIASVTEEDRFPQIAAFHFLEHLDQPAALFKQAALRALPSAHLWVSVPGDRRPSRIFGERDFMDQPPHHMTRWTPAAFREIGIRYGWCLTEVTYEPIPLRAALWSISTHSAAYRRWRNAGWLRNPLVERTFRASAWPVALFRRLTINRRLSGFSMLAHFVFDIHSRGTAAHPG
jgi:SAM-dependent methyltransferase